MMRQYHEAKEAAGDAVLLFRMGDFYELFYEDAEEAGRLLGVTVTTRDKDKGDAAVPMAGFPHHQLDAYLAKILRGGRRAAVCDQVEDPKQAKGLVRREVTRIVSAGTVPDDELLDPVASNYLAAVAFDGAKSSGDTPATVGLAWIDASTGVFYATSLSERRLPDELARLEPTEIVVAEDRAALLPAIAAEQTALTRRPASSFAPRNALETLRTQFGVKGFEGFGFETEAPHDVLALAAAGAVIDYLRETQRSSLAHVERLVRSAEGTRLEIDAATWRRSRPSTTAAWSCAGGRT